MQKADGHVCLLLATPLLAACGWMLCEERHCDRRSELCVSDASRSVPQAFPLGIEKLILTPAELVNPG